MIVQRFQRIVQELFNNCLGIFPEFARLSVIVRELPGIVEKLSKNTSEIIQKLFRNYPEIVQKLSRNCSETIQKLFSNCPRIVQELSRNCPEIVKELSRNCQKNCNNLVQIKFFIFLGTYIFKKYPKLTIIIQYKVFLLIQILEIVFIRQASEKLSRIIRN